MQDGRPGEAAARVVHGPCSPLKRATPACAGAAHCGEWLSAEGNALEFLQPLQCPRGLQRIVIDARSVQAATFLERILRDGGQELLDVTLGRNEGPHIVPIPLQVTQIGFIGTFFIGVSPQVYNQRPARHRSRAGSDVAFQNCKMDLPVPDAKRVQLAALTEVIDFLSRTLGRLALEVGQDSGFPRSVDLFRDHQNLIV